MLNRLRDALVPVVALIWLGMALGVAFVATPSHFMSPHLDLAHALDVNRYTFTLQNRVEIGLALVLLAVLAWARAGRWSWLAAAVVVAIVALQGLWLIPVLAARGEMIMAGQTPPPSPLHDIAVSVELVKLLSLSVLSVLGLRRQN